MAAETKGTVTNNALKRCAKQQHQRKDTHAAELCAIVLRWPCESNLAKPADRRSSTAPGATRHCATFNQTLRALPGCWRNALASAMAPIVDTFVLNNESRVHAFGICAKSAAVPQLTCW